MRKRLPWLIVTGLLAVPLTGSACEPILPLFQLLTGPSLAGPIYLTHSIIWLAVAILVKCAAFILFERRLAWGQAVGFMVVGNVLSTIPGFFLAAFAASGTGVFLAIPLLYVLGSVVHRRWLRLEQSSPLRNIGSGGVVAGFMLFYFLSMFMYGIAVLALDGHYFGGYWIAKFAFVAFTAGGGIVISAFLEECVIANMARKSHGNLSFLPSVFRANYITLGLILLVAALQILPKRLQNPHFIADFLQSIAATLGLA